MAVIGFKNSQAGVEQFPFRHDDDVETGRDLVSTENLSYQAFSSVPFHGAAQFPCGGDPQPADVELVCQDKQGCVSAADSHAVLVDLLKIGAASDPFKTSKSDPHGPTKVGPYGFETVGAEPDPP